MVAAVWIALVVVLVSMVVVIVIVSVAVSMAVLVSAGSVAVPATGELEPGEDETGEDQDQADDPVLGVFDRGSKLQADDDDDGAEDERDEDVCDAGEGGEPGDASRWIPLNPADNGEWHPVIGQDRVSESDAGCRGEKGRPGGAHALAAFSSAWVRVPKRMCSVCETASPSSAPTWSLCNA